MLLRCIWILAGVCAVAALWAQPERTAVRPLTLLQRAQLTTDVAAAKLERVAPDRATLTLQSRVEDAAKLKLLDNDGKEVALATSADGRITANVDPRRGYILTARTLEPRPLGKGDVQFPGRYVTFTPAGGTNLGGLFLRAAAVPLTWNDDVRAYATELLVGYEFQDGAERPLAAPKTVTFFTEGPTARVEADRVVIERSGGSGYKRVVLSTQKPDGETRFTARVGPGDELQSSVGVHREVGGLALSLGAARLPGFGIGSGTLAVTRLARDGRPLSAPVPMTVNLSSQDLRQPATVVIPAGESSVTAEIRTAGLGADAIVAASGSLEASLPVAAVFPTAPIVAAVIGGLLGGAARYLRNRRRTRGLLLRRLLEGALVGVILVGAAWAGLVTAQLGTGVFGTPFGAFVLAALSGYLGCVVLDRVAKRTLG